MFLRYRHRLFVPVCAKEEGEQEQEEQEEQEKEGGRGEDEKEDGGEEDEGLNRMESLHSVYLYSLCFIQLLSS